MANDDALRAQMSKWGLGAPGAPGPAKPEANGGRATRDGAMSWQDTFHQWDGGSVDVPDDDHDYDTLGFDDDEPGSLADQDGGAEVGELGDFDDDDADWADAADEATAGHTHPSGALARCAGCGGRWLG